MKKFGFKKGKNSSILTVTASIIALLVICSAAVFCLWNAGLISDAIIEPVPEESLPQNIYVDYVRLNPNSDLSESKNASNDDSSSGNSSGEGSDGAVGGASGDMPEPVFVPEKPDYVYPAEMRAFYLEPGVDFFENANMTLQEISAEIDSILDKLNEFGFNTIVLDTSVGDSVIYKSQYLKSTSVDILDLFVGKATADGKYIYAVHHVYGFTGSDGKKVSAVMSNDVYDRVMKNAVELVSKYKLNGIILDSYSVEPSSENYFVFDQNFSAVDYNKWLLDSSTRFIKDLTREILINNQTVAVGILTESVWANKSTNPDGSDTNASRQMLTDDRADVKLWVESGYVDFVLGKAFGSTSSTTEPFKTVVKWWAELCKANDIKYFAIQSANKVDSGEIGWSVGNQLAVQVEAARSCSGYGGSAFYGYQKLISDINGNTRRLLDYYSLDYTPEEMNKNLNITFPQSNAYSTYESEITFTGSFDPTYDVTINGEKINPTARGEFWLKLPLEIGQNKFDIISKGSKVTYTVTRKIEVFPNNNCVKPASGNTLELDGGTKVSLEAVAYRGADVYATINGKRYNLAEAAGNDNDNKNSVYVTYTGEFTMPEGIIEQEQNLGNISISASYEGYGNTLAGAKLIVKAIPKPIPPPEPDVPDTGTWTDMPKNQIRVKSDYARLYNYKSTHEYPDPSAFSLPKGTVDYIESQFTVKTGSGTDTYYKTISGKRVKSTEIEAITGEDYGSNELKKISVSTSGGSTYLKIDTSWKAPFDIYFPGIDTSKTYAITAFTQSKLAITFDYTASMPEIEGSFSGGIFSGGVWTHEKTDKGYGRSTLTLTLSKPGIYYGASAYYEGDTLILRFNNPANGLSGLTVFLDPGHGNYLGTPNKYEDTGALGSYLGDDGYSVNLTEAELNWKTANKVKELLTAKGAKVVLLDTYSKFYKPLERPETARNSNPHVFLSIHHNSASGTTATGVEVYYNTPFSQPMAKSIVNSMGKYYSGSMYGDGGNYIRGADGKWSEFAVTRDKQFASVLIEVGFMNNPKELKLLNNDTHRAGLAKAIVDGLEQYAKR